jgi:hypothetical protein
MKFPFKSMRRASAALLAAISGAAIVTPLIATAASAGASELTGYVEVCKNTLTIPSNLTTTNTNINVNAAFNFKISSSAYSTTPITVDAGYCSSPIPVYASTVTITEASGPWYEVSNITADQGSSYLTSTDLATGTATVAVSGTSDVDTVTYTNDPVTGFIEVCKDTPVGSGEGGSYTFDISSANVDGAGKLIGFDTSVTDQMGQCSSPIVVPAGSVTVTEEGSNLNLTGVTGVYNFGSTSAITSGPDLTAGTVTVNVSASTDASVSQTDVTYYDDVVMLKVCKIWDGENAPPGGWGTMFPFTETATGTNTPNTAPGPFSLTASAGSNCSIPTPYAAGTAVTITEGIVPGSKVDVINPTGALSYLPITNGDIANRTVTVTVGTPTSANSAPGNEAVVYFHDESADPGGLKICKTTVSGSTAVAPGTPFNFTVTAADGTSYPVTVDEGSCNIVSVASGNGQTQVPVTFPFNSTVSVSEAEPTNDFAASVTSLDTNVQEFVNGSLTPITSENQIASTTNVGSGATPGKPAVANVMISEGSYLTEVTFTNADPSTSTSSTSSSSSSSSSNTSSSNSSSSNSSSSNSSSSSSSSPSTVTPIFVAPSTSSSNTSTPTVSVNVSSTPSSSLTSAEAAALKSDKVALGKDWGLLKKVLANLKLREQQAARTHGTLHLKLEAIIQKLMVLRNSLRSQITVLKAEVHLLESLA